MNLLEILPFTKTIRLLRDPFTQCASVYVLLLNQLFRDRPGAWKFRTDRRFWKEFHWTFTKIVTPVLPCGKKTVYHIRNAPLDWHRDLSANETDDDDDGERPPIPRRSVTIGDGRRESTRAHVLYTPTKNVLCINCVFASIKDIWSTLNGVDCLQLGKVGAVKGRSCCLRTVKNTIYSYFNLFSYYEWIWWKFIFISRILFRMVLCQ